MTADLTPLDVLRRDGWHKGWYTKGDDGRYGEVCLIGAWVRSKTGDALLFPEGDDDGWMATVADVIAEQFPDRVPPSNMPKNPLPYFNDLPETTFADVELVCEKAQLRYDEAVL